MSDSAQRTIVGGRNVWFLASLVSFGCSEAPAVQPAPQSGGTAGVSAGASGAGGGGGALGGVGAAGGVNGGASGAGAGQSGSAGSSGGAAATFASVAEIMRQNCGALSCHGGGPEGQDIVFVDSTTLYDILLSKVVAECGGSVMVKPGDPANSALLQLPTWQCGDLVMPKGCIDDPCLTAPELEAIGGWISAGAPR